MTEGYGGNLKGKRVLLMITTVIFTIMVSACGKKDISDAESSITSLQSMEKDDVEIMDKYMLHEKERFSSVHIECGGHSGSGVIWEISDTDIVIMSNRHLLERGESADISFATGVYYKASVEFLAKQYDYGLAVIDKSVMDKEDIDALTAVSYITLEENAMIIGEPLYIISSKEYPADAILEGALVETSGYVELEQLAHPQEMILGRLTGTEKMNIQAGMSGSGVFNQYGNFVGILSGGDGEKEYMVVPLWNILTGLQN